MIRRKKHDGILDRFLLIIVLLLLCSVNMVSSSFIVQEVVVFSRTTTTKRTFVSSRFSSPPTLLMNNNNNNELKMTKAMQEEEEGNTNTNLKSIMLGMFVSFFLLLSQPSYASIGFNDNTNRLMSCTVNSNCVSSNYKEPPNRYFSPLATQNTDTNDRDKTFQKVVQDIENNSNKKSFTISSKEIIPKNYYIHLTIPGTAPNSYDDLELVLGEEAIDVRCEARVTLPPPPFCLKRNCINGNMDQRERIASLAKDVLQLPLSDQSRMQGAKWTPIFFNSDRVPGWEE